jgi:large subunit ribosomal protein L24
MGCHLSKELRKKYGKRAVGARRWDKVKIMRGQFKKKTGKIERVDLKKSKVYITGIEIIKKDGTKTLYPIHPSNLIITDLYLDDKKRVKVLERK